MFEVSGFGTLLNDDHEPLGPKGLGHLGIEGVGLGPWRFGNGVLNLADAAMPKALVGEI